MSTLRNRRRERTEQAIRKVAIDLVYENGLDSVTAEMISDIAGISRRTFFNYFPFKEAALLPPQMAIPDAVKEKFVKSSGSLTNDVCDLFTGIMEKVGGDRSMIRRSQELCQSNPKLMYLRSNAFDEIGTEFCALIQKRLGPDCPRENAEHIAELLAASIRVGFANWLENEDVSMIEAVSSKVKVLRGLYGCID